MPAVRGMEMPTYLIDYRGPFEVVNAFIEEAKDKVLKEVKSDPFEKFVLIFSCEGANEEQLFELFLTFMICDFARIIIPVEKLLHATIREKPETVRISIMPIDEFYLPAAEPLIESPMWNKMGNIREVIGRMQELCGVDTQQEIGDIIGFDQSAVSRLMRGEMKLTRERIEKILRGLRKHKKMRRMGPDLKRALMRIASDNYEND